MQTMKNAQAKSSKLMIVDDHPIVCAGLAQVIDQEWDLGVCGVASNAGDALNMLLTEKPDLILIDINLGGDNGLELVKKIRAQKNSAGILVISIFSDNVFAERAISAGANGYVMKEEANNVVIGAIRKVLGGGTFVSSSVADRIDEAALSQHRCISRFPMDTLSDRELEVFNLVGQGFSPSEIAEKLFISPRTVESHKDKIKVKLGLENSSRLLQYAIQYRIIK